MQESGNASAAALLCIDLLFCWGLGLVWCPSLPAFPLPVPMGPTCHHGGCSLSMWFWPFGPKAAKFSVPLRVMDLGNFYLLPNLSHKLSISSLFYIFEGLGPKLSEVSGRTLSSLGEFWIKARGEAHIPYILAWIWIFVSFNPAESCQLHKSTSHNMCFWPLGFVSML